MPAVRLISALQGKEVFCRDKAGIFEGSIIRCKCCNKEFAPSAFENHSGSSFRRPWKSIKDVTGKSIQEYREEQESSQVEVEGVPPTNEKFIVERIVSRRVKQGKKEYLVKWQNFGDNHNSWVPPENFSGDEMIQSFESQRKKDKKRKIDTLSKESSTKVFKNKLDSSPRKSKNQSSTTESQNQSPNNSPMGSSNDWTSSPLPSLPLSPSDRDLEYPAQLEPLFDEASLSSPLTSVSEYDSSAVDDGESCGVSDEDETDILPVSTITVEYEGMRGVFIQVATFRDLLECALDYWEMNELTSIKDWILTNETGAMWPLNQNVRTYSPNVVYLKRKPWR